MPVVSNIKIDNEKFEVTLSIAGEVQQVDHFKPQRGTTPWLRRNLFRATSPTETISWYLASAKVQEAISRARQAAALEMAK